MKSIVIYDSVYGNTEKIAQAIGKVLQSKGASRVVSIKETTVEDLKGIEMLLVGSPTQAFNMLPAVDLVEESAEGQPVRHQGGCLRHAHGCQESQQQIPDLHGILLGLCRREDRQGAGQQGRQPDRKPEGFFVDGREGPMTEGELERAETWAKKLIKERSS